MKLVTFELDGYTRIGYLLNNKVLDLEKAHIIYTNTGTEVTSSQATAEFSNMISFLNNREDACKLTEKIIKFIMGDHELLKKVLYNIEDVTLKAPIVNPPKTMITGPSWKKYVKEGQVPEFVFILKPPTALIGPGENIVIPKDPINIGTEVELAIVVGKSGRYIPRNKALEYIAGFTVFNDVTDYGLYVKRTPRAAIRAKSYDTFAVIGPCITLIEQIGDLSNLKLKLRINGKEYVNICTSEMIYPLTHFITSVSEVMTLQVGDIISTGCPEVVPVSPGDCVEAEIENIGILKNRFVAWNDQY